MNQTEQYVSMCIVLVAAGAALLIAGWIIGKIQDAMIDRAHARFIRDNAVTLSAIRKRHCR